MKETTTPGEVESTLTVDPVLENNSWETIIKVWRAGKMLDYWSFGDTKTDVGADGVTRTFIISKEE